VSLKQLAVPLIEAGRKALAESGSQYTLIAHDWSHLDYSAHGSKKDRTQLKGKPLWGYELHTALVLSEETGAPYSVLCQNLLAADGLHSTRSEEVLPEVSQLDGLSDAIRFVDDCELGKPTVHLADRECDSVGHYRQWQHERRFFVVRGKTHRQVQHGGQEKSVRRVIEELAQQQGFRYSREVEFKGRMATQFVAETAVVITRPAKPHRTRHGPTSRRVPGAAIALRLVISHIKDQDGTLLSEWLLWTNVPGREQADGVPDTQIAQWYYWRWKIESFFKLLKSAGHSIEQWQQENATAIAKRLLVATMACVVVWQLARNPAPEASALRQLLGRLSGRQMKRGTAFTEPALLAGLGILLVMLDVVTQYDIAEIQCLTRIVLPGPYP
jgi:Transposase DDE domain